MELVNHITEVMRAFSLFFFWGSCLCVIGIIFWSCFTSFVEFVADSFK